MNTKSAVTLLSSIAQEARLDIFRLLVQAGPDGVAAGAISEQLAIPASTLSFHLKELTYAGLVIPKPQGRYIFYTAHYAAMENLLAYLTENCCQGRQSCGPLSNCSTDKETAS